MNNAAEMTLSDASITRTGAGKNGVQNSGTLTVSGCEITDSKNHGIYNAGTLSGTDVTIKTVGDNGIYNAGGTVDALKGLSISGTRNQGVNNTGTFVASNVTISGTGKNGVYNNGGTVSLSGLTVTGPGEHGVSNDNGGIATLANATLNGSGTGSNCIQNKGTMTVQDVTALDSSNHGVYNDSTFIAKGKLTISGAAANGLYNYGGNVTLADASISGAGSHGINNAGTLTAEKLTVDGVISNGIQNTGVMSVTGSALITDSGKHGIYNGKTFDGANITVTNAGDLLASNGGDMTVHGLTLDGSANKALYNSGYAELYTVTVDGTDVSYASAQYLIDNNGGVLDLTDATILWAKGTALHNRGKASASVTNVIIDHAGNYGIFVESGSTLSGDGLVINNITKNTEAVAAAEGIAIKTAGVVTMMDHVTLGAYADGVTGSGVEIDKSESGLASTALQLDAAAASYSGYDLTIRNGPSGNAVYNKGIMYVTDLYVENVKHGIVCRYTGWATLSGDVAIKDVANNPISIYGPEGNGYANGVTLTSGANLTIENAGSHAINNKGSFLAAADTTVTIKNVVGKNINAINNQSGAAMTLGDVTIDGVYVTITMYDETTINSNSGNGIQSNSALEINGDVVISNIFYKAENSKTENSNGSGVVVKNGGSITGTGSITVIGSQTAPEGYEGYTGLFNGIFTTKCTIDIDGDISVSNASNQGIYVADANAAVECGNITVTGSQGNGIYVNNASGKLTASGSITLVGSSGGHGLSTKGAVTAGDIYVEGSASGKQGINLDGDKASVTAANITVKDAGGNGIYINNAKGTLTAADITVTGSTAGHGISTKGSITAEDIYVDGAASGKQGLNLDGDGASVTADNITVKNSGGNGIYINNKAGKLTVSGKIDIDTTAQRGLANTQGATVIAGDIVTGNTTGDGITNGSGGKIYAASICVTNSAAAGITSSSTVDVTGDVTIDTVTDGAGVKNTGSFTVGGTLTVKNVTGTDVNAIHNGSKTMTLNNVSVDGLKVTVGKDADGKDITNVGNGIFNEGTLTLNGTAAITNVFTSVKGNSQGAGVCMASGSKLTGTGSLVITGSTSGDEAYPYDINNGIFLDAATIELTGDITVSGVTNQGIYVANENAALTAGNITINNVTGNGIYINKTTGSLTVSGTISIDGTDNHGLSNVGTVTAGNVTIKNIPNKNGLENTGTFSVTGTLSVSDITVGYGIHSKGGTVQASTMKVSNVLANIGIFLESSATLKGYSVTLDSINSQGIQANHANTIEIQTLTMTNIAKNGLRLYNNSANPTVTVGDLIAGNCGEYALAAQKTITSDDLYVGTVWYENCGKGAVHGNVTSGVGAIKNELPAAEDETSATETEN